MPGTGTQDRLLDEGLPLPGDALERERDHRGPRVPDRLLTLGALGVIVAGVAMRLYALGGLPRGLFTDEAFYGLDALSVLRGAHPLYFPANNGREPLFIYLMAATIGLFGRNPLGLRAAAALCGLLTLPATYLLGRAWGNRRVGLLSTALLAGTLWHIHLSRVGFRVGTLPLFLALSLGLGALALRSRSRALLIATGVAYGLSFYTYLSARFTPLALLAMGAYGLIWHRDRLRGRAADAAWIAGAALLTALPLGVYALMHPDVVFVRSSEVAIWNASVHHGDPMGALLTGALRVLGMFTFRGDENWRHNVPHRPIFDPFVSIVFLAGIVLAITGWRRRPIWALSVIWIAVMTLPTVLANEPPHFLRSVGELPMLMLLPALTLDAGLRWLSRAPGRRDAGAPGGRASALRRSPICQAAPLAVLLLVAGSATLSARDYFGRRLTPALPLSGFDFTGAYLSDPICGYAFFAPLTELGQQINAAAGTVYLDRVYWDTLSSLRFVVSRKDGLVLYDAGSALSPGKLPLTLVGWARMGVPQTLRVLPPGSQITVLPGDKMRADDTKVFAAYVRWVAEPLPESFPERAAPLARFASGLSLLDVRSERAAQGLTLRLRWSKSRAAVAPALLSVQALALPGRELSRQEDLVGTPYYPPPLWDAGSVIEQRMTLPLPGGDATHLRLELRELDSGKSAAVIASRAVRQADALIVPIAVSTRH